MTLAKLEQLGKPSVLETFDHDSDCSIFCYSVNFFDKKIGRFQVWKNYMVPTPLIHGINSAIG